MRVSVSALRVLVGAVAFFASASAAQAYPQWQLSTGAARCDQCHYAPAGGGLLNAFGRDAAGEDLSTFGGDGAFLHGVARLPGWLALGGDLRGAFVAEDLHDLDGTTVAAFPMQADAEGRVSYSFISFYGVLGLRGQVRPNEPVVPDQNYQPITESRLISREHYLMLRASPLGGYLRVGRFFAPFGLRLAEHILYVRRDLGFNTLEESYNLSGGYVAERWELHATAFAPDFLRHMGSTEGGFAAYLEGRPTDAIALAVQARVGVGPGLTRTTLGALGKYWVAPLRTMFMAEADFVRRDIDAVPNSYQFVGLGGLTVMPIKGVMVSLFQERNQVDLSVRGAAYDATDAFVSWFPYAHFEVQALERLQFPSGGQTVKTFFVQVHYFL